MARTHSFQRMISALFGCLCIFAGTTVAIEDNSVSIQDDLVSWVRSKGGTFSDKIEIRRADPEDPTSYMGIFVREPIQAKESLFAIPRDCYIHVFDTASEFDPKLEDARVEAAYQENLCKLATKLMNEMKLGNDSVYAPYIAYLKTQTPGQLPANWSPQGKELLRKVAIPGSSMVDWIDWNFKGEKHDCIDTPKSYNDNSSNNNQNSNNNGSDSGISFEEHMVEMTIQRCFDTSLIPIWDMVNHDNGNINTETNSLYDEDGIKVRASRNLDAGEEVFSSYDKCLDCKGVEDYWGTPEILKDFGFVENYPHRWVFTDQNIWFEVYQDYEFDAYFGAGHEDAPSDQQVEFLTKELTRLEEVGKSILEDQGTLSNREWSTIRMFHEAAVIDLYAVVEWYTHPKNDDASNADGGDEGEL